jgi:hypothetical protein
MNTHLITLVHQPVLPHGLYFYKLQHTPFVYTLIIISYVNSLRNKKLF